MWPDEEQETLNHVKILLQTITSEYVKETTWCTNGIGKTSPLKKVSCSSNKNTILKQDYKLQLIHNTCVSPK